MPANDWDRSGMMGQLVVEIGDTVLNLMADDAAIAGTAASGAADFVQFSKFLHAGLAMIRLLGAYVSENLQSCIYPGGLQLRQIGHSSVFERNLGRPWSIKRKDSGQPLGSMDNEASICQTEDGEGEAEGDRWPREQ
jgi:hypothetical protein